MAIQEYTGLDLGFAKLEDSACHLLAIFFADKAIHEHIAEYSPRGIKHYYNEAKEDVIVQQLIQIATLYRIQIWKIDDEHRQKEKDKEAGILYIGDSENGMPLSMLEACNKIIHADEIYFETIKEDDAPISYLDDCVVIFGRKGKTEWEAHIVIPCFCDWALQAPNQALIEFDSLPQKEHSPKIKGLFKELRDEFNKGNSNQSSEPTSNPPSVVPES